MIGPTRRRSAPAIRAPGKVSEAAAESAAAVRTGGGAGAARRPTSIQRALAVGASAGTTFHALPYHCVVGSKA